MAIWVKFLGFINLFFLTKNPTHHTFFFFLSLFSSNPNFLSSQQKSHSPSLHLKILVAKRSPYTTLERAANPNPFFLGKNPKDQLFHTKKKTSPNQEFNTLRNSNLIEGVFGRILVQGSIPQTIREFSIIDFNY